MNGENKTSLAEPPNAPRGLLWRKSARRRLETRYAFDGGLWRWGAAGAWLVSMLAAVTGALGMPTGLGVAFDVVAGMALVTIAMAAAGWLSAIVLGLMLAGVRLPRFCAGCFLIAAALSFSLLQYAEWIWWVALAGALLVTGSGTAVGLAVGFIRERLVRYIAGDPLPRLRWVVGIALSSFAIVAALYSVSATGGFLSSRHYDDAADLGAEPPSADRAASLLAEDPGLPGAFAVQAFTYGSGKDKHRPEFGDDATLLSDSVDGSRFAKGWKWPRTLFWGFDAAKLPVNGRVWIPKSDDTDPAGASGISSKQPFPLVLMVHGNHLMEHFSDEGYGYLGELLASRGFIAVSVDENFLNYSAWSDIPEDDMIARPWMLLQHIRQIQQFAARPGTPFYERVDWRRVALLGHSRGGQAAAMAASPEHWFDEETDHSLPNKESYKVQAVVAIAPTDTKIGNALPALDNVSLLTMHGAKDTDLVNFFGDRLYNRTRFESGSAAAANAFKATLFIGDANHSRFNTAWGPLDNALPTGLFVRPEGVLKGEEQQAIAKTYVAAFMELALYGKEENRALFRDARAGGAFLPSGTRYVTRYEDAGFRPIARFEGGDAAQPADHAMATASGMREWKLREAADRQGQSKGSKGIKLLWDSNEAAYTLTWTGISPSAGRDGSFVFSLAVLPGADTNLALDVELKDARGTAVRLPLERFRRFAGALPNPVFVKPEWLEPFLVGGKLDDPPEAVYQTYFLPLQAFRQMNPVFRAEEWNGVTFHFAGRPGAVMLDDIGFEPDEDFNG